MWDRWSGPAFDPGAARPDRLTDVEAASGAFRASIQWYLGGPDASELEVPGPSAPPVDVRATVL